MSMLAIENTQEVLWLFGNVFQSEVKELDQALRQFVSQSVKGDLVVDMSAVQSISTSAAKTLLTVAQEAEERGGRLKVRSSVPVVRTLNQLGADTWCEIETCYEPNRKPNVRTVNGSEVVPALSSGDSGTRMPVARRQSDAHITPVARCGSERQTTPMAGRKTEVLIRPVARHESERRISPVSRRESEEQNAPAASRKTEVLIRPIVRRESERRSAPAAGQDDTSPPALLDANREISASRRSTVGLNAPGTSILGGSVDKDEMRNATVSGAVARTGQPLVDKNARLSDNLFALTKLVVMNTYTFQMPGLKSDITGKVLEWVGGPWIMVDTYGSMKMVNILEVAVIDVLA